jgi:predicted protein tyrosine phosphatase
MPRREPIRLLFVCSRNRRRSLTAETAFRGDPRYQVRSAGTEPSARIRVSDGLLRWAEVVFVMERRHAEILSRSHPEAVEGLPIVNLRIPDEFELDDPSLIHSLREAVAAEFGTEP